jgi:hypothetical protein
MFLFICGLFNGAVNISDYVSSNDSMLREIWIGEDVEEVCHGQIWGTIRECVWRDCSKPR